MKITTAFLKKHGACTDGIKWFCPTPEQCSNHEVVSENEHYIYKAIWYPQMGGYVGRALVEINKEYDLGNCFDVYVWHDGEFPFGGEQEPARLHHCDYKQFVLFGLTIRKFLKGNQ
jgi:hypothetical protein